MRILLIEDNPDDALLIKEALTEVSGIPLELEWVDRVSLGLERLDASGIDVVLTDLNLPDSAAAGIDTLLRLRARAPDLPVVIMTGQENEKVALEALEKGAQDYLIKGEVGGRMLYRVARYAIERKRAETELRNASLKLSEALMAKEKFIARVSHELRTPVTVIKEGVSLLLDGTIGPLGEKQIEFLRLVSRNCQRLTELVSSVLDLSKTNAGRMRFLREKIKLRELIEEVLKESQSLTGKRIVKLEGAEARAVLGDTENIRQVLTNLLSNAVKFTKDDGTITFSIREEGEFVTVTVRDDGVGIAKDDLQKLFQEFSQVGEYKAGGTGLGLALCKSTIERHKGTISAASEMGKGATFTFTLPFYTSKAALEESFKDLVEESAKHSGSSTVALIAVDCEGLIKTRGMEVLEELEKLLRSQLKNGDVLIGFEPKWLILLAVADARGVRAINRRILGVLEEWAPARHLAGGGLPAGEAGTRLGSAFYPVDGTDAYKLFSIAQGACA